MKLCNELQSKRKHFHSEEGSHRQKENIHSLYTCIQNTKRTHTMNDKRKKKRMNYKRKKKTMKNRQRLEKTLHKISLRYTNGQETHGKVLSEMSITT